MKKNNIINSLTIYLFYLSAFLFFLAFNFQDSRTGGWYQQFLPNLNGRSISDVTFLDSLIGYAVANSQTDTNYILKTTNGGDNWSIISRNYNLLQRVQFLNLNTGYVCGSALLKTTNSGLNWLPVNTSGISAENMFVISQDTIWITDHNSLVGGAFLSTNGGASWNQKYGAGVLNPSNVYFFNSRIGFIGLNAGTKYIAKTTNGGNNWSTIVNNDYFQDIYFYDSLLGWKCSVYGMKKTIDGGLNWVTQQIPNGGNIIISGIQYFFNINKDTIWGTGGTVLLPSNTVRGILYRSTNQGSNWFYQIPDTSIHIGGYTFIDFINKLNGWAGILIHTKTGGDTSFLSSVHQISTIVPNEYKLYQNYPNPFNQSTIINVQLPITKQLKVEIFDITGKLIKTIVNKKENSGLHGYSFEGGNFSSGIYFYSLFIDDERIDTKKAILIK